MGSFGFSSSLCLLVLSLCVGEGSVVFAFHAGTKPEYHQIQSVRRSVDHTSCMHHRTTSIHRSLRKEKATALGITLPWFSGKNEGDKGLDDEGAMARDGKGTLGGVAGTMDSMDSFKKAQRVGKRTSALVQELSATTVEGSSADGKVKIIFDCQQRPIKTIIDEAYFEATDISEVSNAITAAMKDAHAKSIERMDEKMKSFYSELGMPPSS
jgi:DNA-binding YbaB/EbfC family protein